MLAAFVVLPFLAAFVHGVAFHPSVHSLIASRGPPSQADIPPKCHGPCGPMITTLGNCSASADFTCGCDNSTIEQMDACFDCLLELVPTVESQLAETKEMFSEACHAAGKPIEGAHTEQGSHPDPDQPLITTEATSSENSPSSTTAPVESESSTSSPDANNAATTPNPVESADSSSFPSENNAATTSLWHPCLIIMSSLVFGGMLGI